ncbi:Putative aminoacrylate hydrolase RutD [Leucobacter soli]|uniref:Aminoacrylate hydrolase RutD n=2 Tax=Leucobacter soli TaxID=2812850 RepID=A0A916NHS1_9MICO|nr:alpha/beta fold hydrolase [Leucobacter soli]CAG7611820.1 Putative aminoacrylate hydrolase RutD [Leucobacter soli]
MTTPPILLTEPTGPAGAPLLVLGHSLGTGTLIWENAVPALATDYRVTLLTLPGHEGAPVPNAPFTLAELADAVAEAAGGLSDDGRFFYAGVSIGGALGLELAVRHPDRVRGAAIIASGAELGGPEHWQARAQLVREQSPASLVAASSKVWFAPEAFTEEPVMVGRILRVLQETSAEGYARCAEALASYDVREQLGEIEVPLLALWGEHDTVGTEPKQDEIVTRAQRARKQMVAGAAHQPPAEKPAATADALLEFFGGLR